MLEEAGPADGESSHTLKNGLVISGGFTEPYYDVNRKTLNHRCWCCQRNLPQIRWTRTKPKKYGIQCSHAPCQARYNISVTALEIRLEVL